MTAVDPARFRQLLGRFATGVVIVTTVDDEDVPAGMTANTLTSVSLEPPLVSICIDHTAEMHRILQNALGFAVNILAANQEALSRRFAEPDDRRFDGIGYYRTERGSIVLEGALAHIECEHFAAYPAGDHSIYVGRVVGGEANEGEPLLYYRGGYTDLGRG